ncbi:hypothetical protein CANCADRAFT_31775 [Tortispora caseinolytica NRRL Y-17796]|uniref:Autophagy-related protein n=1 Tax=Tortispora caseinolytica NRRL Y-17796 TaxID=767744 RepID=A0A1E4TGT9_9ASCO|nr:hypothetical protein CANCADRAFT_31775 [Tortispora caseinolytica NRRL Y-17796]
MSDSTTLLFSNDEAEPPTSPSEIWGWLSFAWASEPFIVCGMGSFIPILLEQYAAENAVYENDPTKHCQPNLKLPMPPSSGTNDIDLGRCLVPILDRYVTSSGFALYAFAFSVFIQAICVISFSGSADKANNRKKLLVSFAALGGISVIMLSGVSPDQFYLLPCLVAMANTAFGMTSVCGNSFLPLLSRNDPDVKACTDESVASIHALSFSELDSDLRREIDDTMSNVAAKLSSKGLALGYLAAFLVQICGLVILSLFNSSTNGLRCALLLIGIWWLVFDIPSMYLIRSRPIYSITSESNTSLLKEVVYGWQTLFKTVREARKLRDITTFLVGWFFLSDSITTISSSAILFAKTELHMKSAGLATISIVVMAAAILGALSLDKVLHKHASLSSLQSLIIYVAIACIVPLYGVAGFFTNRIGFHYPGEMYIAAVVYGLALGGVGASSRAVYSQMIPPGRENIYFSLYSVTDKGSSIVGPFMTGVITDRTLNIRYSFYLLLGMLLISIPLFFSVKVQRGEQAAKTFIAENDI